MVVHVRLYATLRRPSPDGPQNRLSVDLPDGATVSDLLARLGIEQSADHVMAILNHRRVGPDHRLQPEDELHLLPPISGG
ncbi:MAG: MoaD/ThiS family protein [Chloroflexi bacterium]|nr:MAG: MoaD/ThiS family protein [Chloroflexota bacterium]